MNWTLTNRDYLPGYRTLILLLVIETAILLVAVSGSAETQITVALCVLAPMFIFILPLYPQVGFPFMIITTGLDILAVIGDPQSERYFHVTWFHIVLILTWISAITNYLLSRRHYIPSTTFGLPLTLYFLVVALSLTFTPNFEEGVLEIIRMMALSTIFFLAITFFKTKRSIHLVLVPLLIVPFGVGVLTIWQFLTQGTFFTPLVAQVASNLGFRIYRAMGTFDNPNSLGTFLMTGVIVPFGLLFVKRIGKIWKILFVFMFIFNGLALVGSFSRAGWLSAAIACITILVLNKKFRYLFSFGIIFALFIIVLILFTPFSDYVFFRFTSIFNPSEDPSSQSRICLAISAWWMFLDNPIFGVGFRGYPKLAYDYIHPQMPQVLSDVREAHTLPAEIIAELGLVGVIVTTWIFVVIVREAILGIKELKDDFLSKSEIIFFSLFIAFLVNFLFATDLVNNVFWIVTGMIYAVRRMPSNSASFGLKSPALN